MKTTQITIKDIAKQLNISVSTVSRALRGMPEINPETRKAVIELAEKLDYQPNQLAKNLAKSSTKTIGVIVPNLSYYFFSAVLNSIEEAAMQAGYSVLVCQTNESRAKEVINIQNLMRGQVEGLLISLSRETDDCEHIHKLLQKNVPLVLFDRYMNDLDASKVIVDNHTAAFKATEHLIENQCDRIGFLAGPPHLLISNQRLSGYKAALEKHGIAFDSRYVFHCDYTKENAINQTLAMMELHPAPNGIFTVSDRVALATIFALKSKGYRIPQDVAIVSFNNEPVCEFLTPSLSSISQPIDTIGKESVRLLLEQIESKEDQLPKKISILETDLVIRESSVRVKNDSR
ncbi:MAG: LacI family transcriptional regulator [Thermoflexibacter sp.]|jgi:LacI family transcriptional regulator|nr:LacI family transcriptional regulator [Thermoflexibacter sp.]